MATFHPPLNYRHAYHAGNFADVFKHAVLVALLERCREKPAPFCYIDTHAGRGVYPLDGTEAGKTREADNGIRRLLGAQDLPASLRTYVDLVRSFNSGTGRQGTLSYPGSPCIATRMLRSQDHAVLCELEDGEARALRSHLGKSRSAHIHQRDGYAALRALVPPAQKRGLVLIDPPFEAREGEFGAIRHALAAALEHWPSGRYVVWYPIKLRRSAQPFQRWLQREQAGNTLIAEFLVHPANSALRLNGCGLAIINPPWQFERTLRDILDALRVYLAHDAPCQTFMDPPLEAGPGLPHVGVQHRQPARGHS